MAYNPGTGIYTLPAVYLAVPGTTILATQHNTPLEDLEVANNYARPIVAGGTGQNSAVLARGSTGLATMGNIGVKGSNIASAAALALVADFNYFHVTGVVAVTSISTRPAGERIVLEFEGILILTHNATSLILPGGVNKTTAAGDVAEFVSEGSGNWRCVQYTNASGAPIVIRPPKQQIIAATGTYTKTAGATWINIEAVGGGGGSGGCAQNGASTYGATGGGGSGFWGNTGLIDATAFVSGTATIGAAGAAGASAAGTGGTGGATSITIGATTYTWGGGDGSPGYTAQAVFAVGFCGNASTGTNVIGTGPQGTYGISMNGASATGGVGGSNPLGTGGNGVQTLSTGGSAGTVGTGFGSGGGGATAVGATSSRAGAAGKIGWMRITEYFS